MYSIRLCLRPAHTLPEWTTPTFGWHAVWDDAPRYTWAEYVKLDVPAVDTAATRAAALAAAAKVFGVAPEQISVPG